MGLLVSLSMLAIELPILASYATQRRIVKTRLQAHTRGCDDELTLKRWARFW